MNGHGKIINGGGLPAGISKELEKRNIGQRLELRSMSKNAISKCSFPFSRYLILIEIFSFFIYPRVSNIFGKTRNKGNAYSNGQNTSNNQWNVSQSTAPRRRSGPPILPHDSDGSFDETFPSTNRSLPGSMMLSLKYLFMCVNISAKMVL